jgi:hypothetical protein
VPRAKRTNRAEARRRHRAALEAPEFGEPIEDAEPADVAPERGHRPSQPARPPTERPSITRAFREAFHPVTLREDLQAFPQLLLHRAVWLPVLLTVVAGLALVATNGSNVLVSFAAAYFLAPPALGSVFLGGFLAPRSSYLVGLVVGLASAVVASLIVLSLPSLSVTGDTSGNASPSPSAVVSPSASGTASAPASPAATSSPAATPAASPGTGAEDGDVSAMDQITYFFMTSPPFGIFFAASAAWYRRFLRLSNPNRGRPQQQRRGSDGRSRAKPNQRRR